MRHETRPHHQANAQNHLDELLPGQAGWISLRLDIRFTLQHFALTSFNSESACSSHAAPKCLEFDLIYRDMMKARRWPKRQEEGQPLKKGLPFVSSVGREISSVLWMDPRAVSI